MENLQIDPRIQQLSYSSLLSLHNCPRKFQLYKLNSKQEVIDDGGSSSITFLYGHIVGEAIQLALQNKTEDEILWHIFLNWSIDFLDVNEKQNKSIFTAILAMQKFLAIRKAGYLEDYELYYHNSEPAVELSFIIELPNGFKYRGFVDAVLVHSKTKQVLVLECKTTSATILNAAQYKNSAQAIGYSIVLDVLFPDLSSYEVMYLVFKTKSMEYESLPFTKSYLQRALWIQELLLDVDTIRLYENTGIYPMRGESCYDFWRECEYLNQCTLSTEYLVEPLTVEIESKIREENSKYQIKLSLHDLIEAQLRKE